MVFFVCFLVFQDKVLCSPGCSETQSVDLVGTPHVLFHLFGWLALEK